MRVVAARSTSIALFAALLAATASCSRFSPASSTQPPMAGARDELLAADRRLGAAQPDVMLPDKLLAAFSANVHFFAGGQHVHGKDAARALLATNPANPTSTIEWSAIAGDVSADGTNGYTYGLTDQRRADGGVIAGKYLAYWVRENGAWRMAAFKRAFRGPGVAPARNIPPEPLKAAGIDSLSAAREVAAAEKAFSDDAGVRGTVAAFYTAASQFAATMGGPEPGFRHGPKEVSEGVGTNGDTRNIVWSSDEVLVARSGDLGLSMGTIRVKADTGAPRPPSPFFTIWRRENGKWRYLAE